MATPETPASPATPTENHEIVPKDEGIHEQSHEMVPENEKLHEHSHEKVPESEIIHEHSHEMVPENEKIHEHSHEKVPENEMIHEQSHEMVPENEKIHERSHEKVPENEIIHEHSCEKVLENENIHEHSHEMVPENEIIHEQSHEKVPENEKMHKCSHEKVPENEIIHGYSHEMVPENEKIHERSREKVPENEMIHEHSHEMVPENEKIHERSREKVPENEIIHEHSREKVPENENIHEHSHEMVPENEIIHEQSHEKVPENEKIHKRSHEKVPENEIMHEQSHEMVPENEKIHEHSHEKVPENEIIHEQSHEMVLENEKIHECSHEKVPENEIIHEQSHEMVPENEMIHEHSHEMVPENEMIHEQSHEMVPENEMIHEQSHEKVPENEIMHEQSHEKVLENEIIHKHSHEMVLENEMRHEHSHEMVPEHEMTHEHSHEMVPEHEMTHEHSHEMVPENEMMHEHNHEMVRENEMMHGHNHEMVPENEMMHEHHMVFGNEIVPSNEMVPDDEMIPLNEMVLAEPEPNYIETPPNNPETQPSKRRKKKSIVWEHFTIENIGNGTRRAQCKQCKQSFAYSTGSKVAGTSHLKRHIAKGTCPVVLRNQQNNQLTPYSTPPKMSGYGGSTDAPKRRYRTASAPYLAFDPDRCRQEISRMIIMHDYPLHMVEHPGFLSFVRNLQPRFDMLSFNTVQGDCVATYLREKQAIQKVIEGVPGRICLTLDMWSSCYNVGYMFITGQYIDSEWKIHRKILNIIMEPYPDSDTAFSHAVAACLSDWSMEGKLFSVTINQPLGDAAVDNLRALLSVQNPLVLNGQLLVGSCLARTLSSIAQGAFVFLHGTVKKVRDSVKYVKTSESHEEKFLDLKQQLQVPSTKTLSLDDQTQWNTTYEMLLAASELKEVFSCLDTSDPDYKDAPSMEDWKQVEVLCNYLKTVFDTANLLTAPTVPTTNTFFHEAWKIQLELVRAAGSEDPFISSLTKTMQEEFDKYWKNCCLILAIAVVMDPRFKVKLVEFSFTKIYGEEAGTYVNIVEEGIHELFREYVALPLPLTPAYAEEVNDGALKQENGGAGLTDFDAYIMETTSQQSRSELDQYLDESLLPRVHEFDVVGWWKLNRIKYPTLSIMARDILSVPVSTVTSDSVFSTAGKEMDRYRCSLRPETVEALICAKDWLQNASVNTLHAPIKMEVPI
ncbi:Zinc finger BED domain-containing protein RICESLEEPER 2 [Capsicum annuum]|nr:Zinc finger BED domain-containing protein RICESLEEPER 2 [Capsicum annuum]